MIWIFFALLEALANARYFIVVKTYITALDPRLLTAGTF